MFEAQHFKGRLVDKGFHSVLITHPVAAGDRVIGVFVQAVVRLDDCGCATFCRNRVAAHGIDFGNNGNTEVGVGFRNGDRRA